MNKKLLTGIAILGLAAGFAASQFYASKQSPTAMQQLSPVEPAVMKSSHRPDYKLKDLNDKLHSASEWDGNVVVVNFWATWCPPCRREIPAFIKFQEAYASKGFTFVGIALDEKSAVLDFTDPMGMNYPILIAEQEGIQLSLDYGNRLSILPFTVVLDRKGNIVKHIAREVDFEGLEAIVKPLL